jgi:uncharacterized protein (DUF2062 family)
MRRVRYIFYKWMRKIVRLNDTPHSIATGASIGMFIGMLPVYGFQMIIAAAIAAVSRVNKVAAIVPVWITNPVTIPIILYLQYMVGKLFLSTQDVPNAWEKLNAVGRAAGGIRLTEFRVTVKAFVDAAYELGPAIVWPTLLGCFVSGVVMGLATYPLVLRAVIWYRRKKEARRARRRERLAAYLEEKAREEAAAEGQPEPEQVAPPGP